MFKELDNNKNYTFKLINDSKLKSNITDLILRQLPEWFGIEESIVEYISGVKETIFYAAFDNDKPIGFISLKFNNEYTSEIYSMGIIKEYHNICIGRELIEKVVAYSQENSYRLLMVKTLG